MVPEFGHLPFVTGEGNRKLSKRDPQSNLFQYRDDGFITEGMVNYLALLGWSIGDDRDIFTPAELVAAFDGRRISGNPARFDRKKAESINGAHLRMLTPEDFAQRLESYLVARGLLPAGACCEAAGARPGGRAAGAGALRAAVRGGGDGAVPVHRRGRVRGRSGRCRQGLDARVEAGAGGGHHRGAGVCPRSTPASLEGRAEESR